MNPKLKISPPPRPVLQDIKSFRKVKNFYKEFFVMTDELSCPLQIRLYQTSTTRTACVWGNFPTFTSVSAYKHRHASEAVVIVGALEAMGFQFSGVNRYTLDDMDDGILRGFIVQVADDMSYRPKRLMVAQG